MIVQMLTLQKKKQMSKKKHKTRRKTERKTVMLKQPKRHIRGSEIVVFQFAQRYTSERRATHVPCSLHRHLSVQSASLPQGGNGLLNTLNDKQQAEENTPSRESPVAPTATTVTGRHQSFLKAFTRATTVRLVECTFPPSPSPSRGAGHRSFGHRRRAPKLSVGAGIDLIVRRHFAVTKKIPDGAVCLQDSKIILVTA